MRSINLTELDSLAVEIQEAIAFYTACSILPISFSLEDRERHYKVLEEAGYIERIGA